MQRITKATHASFLTALDSEMRAVNAVIGKVDYQPDNPTYTLDTPAGEYTCHADVPLKMDYKGWRPRYDLTLYGRFKDSERVEKWAGLRFFNGKWNFHFGHREIGEVPGLAAYIVNRIVALTPNDIRAYEAAPLIH